VGGGGGGKKPKAEKGVERGGEKKMEGKNF